MHCLAIQLLKLCSASSFPKLLLAELCLRKLEKFVLNWLLLLVVPSRCCCRGAAERPKLINLLNSSDLVQSRWSIVDGPLFCLPVSPNLEKHSVSQP